jgi:ankyrin repeat protein
MDMAVFKGRLNVVRLLRELSPQPEENKSRVAERGLPLTKMSYLLSKLGKLVGELLTSLKAMPLLRDLELWEKEDGWSITSLHHAARLGNPDIVAELLASSFEVNRLQVQSPDLHGATPLHLASMHGFPEVARLLLDANAGTIDERYGNLNETALGVACAMGHVETVELLLGRGANARMVAKMGPDLFISALLIGILHGKEDVTSAIAMHDPTLIEVRNHLELGMGDGTSLHTAAWRGQATTVKLFLSLGADFSGRDSSQQTILHYAVNGCERETIALCLRFEAFSMDMKDRLSREAEIQATRMDKVENLCLSLSNGQPNDKVMTELEHICNVDPKEDPNVANDVADLANYDSVSDADMDHALGERLETIKVICEACPSLLNAQEGRGYTALHCALGTVDNRVLETLLEFNPDTSIRAFSGQTPLELAVTSGLQMATLSLARVQVLASLTTRVFTTDERATESTQ